jgi:hypothetical protein
MCIRAVRARNPPYLIGISAHGLADSSLHPFEPSSMPYYIINISYGCQFALEMATGMYDNDCGMHEDGFEVDAGDTLGMCILDRALAKV